MEKHELIKKLKNINIYKSNSQIKGILHKNKTKKEKIKLINEVIEEVIEFYIYKVYKPNFYLLKEDLKKIKAEILKNI